MEAQASQGRLGAEGDCGTPNLLVPSPQSEAVTQDMEELTLQPTLPPLSERKNGERSQKPLRRFVVVLLVGCEHKLQ